MQFTWTDRASDEEGYLLEVQAAGRSQYRVAAVIDTDMNAFGLMTLPEEKTAAFRIRAFYYGDPSNIADQKTSPDSPASAPAAVPPDATR